MAATDARAVPKKGVAFRYYFWIIDKTTGLPITGATGVDCEISKDGAAFADCSGTETEVPTTSRGQWFVDFTTGEMNVDHLGIYVTSSSTNAQPVYADLYPADRDIDDLAFPTTSGRGIDVTATGEVGLDFTNTLGALTPVSGSTQAGGDTTHAKLATTASAVDDAYNGRYGLFTYSDGTKRHALITDYVGATRLATLDREVPSLDNTTTLFDILTPD